MSDSITLTEFSRTTNADIDSSDVTRWTLEKYSRLIRRYLETRDRLGLDDRIYDVPYEQIRSDPMPAVREIYRRAGHTLTPQSEALMAQYERDNEQGKHGAHTYSLEDYGLSKAIIDEHFGDYIARFIR